jgi:hypothetical protein
MSYNVVGATLTLRVPDGRFVVVNCSRKVNWGTGMPIRSCRIPLVETFNADFKGKNAKLIWPVSLDGKKTESETYTILAILLGNSNKN